MSSHSRHDCKELFFKFKIKRIKQLKAAGNRNGGGWERWEGGGVQMFKFCAGIIADQKVKSFISICCKGYNDSVFFKWNKKLFKNMLHYLNLPNIMRRCYTINRRKCKWPEVQPQ